MCLWGCGGERGCHGQTGCREESLRRIPRGTLAWRVNGVERTPLTRMWAVRPSMKSETCFRTNGGSWRSRSIARRSLYQTLSKVIWTSMRARTVGKPRWDISWRHMTTRIIWSYMLTSGRKPAWLGGRRFKGFRCSLRRRDRIFSKSLEICDVRLMGLQLLGSRCVSRVSGSCKDLNIMVHWQWSVWRRELVWEVG